MVDQGGGGNAGGDDASVSRPHFLDAPYSTAGSPR
jgi:hypothetical protein